MSLLRYISHPQVRVSADIPVPRWGLSDEGRKRITAIATSPWVTSVERLLSSDETKALETAAVIAVANELSVEVRDDLGENDRSSTGFVPPTRFEELANAFFAEPDVSVEGWETSRDAQRRIVRATSDLTSGSSGDVVVIGHGGVGTLLLCHFLDVPINRDHDQNGPTAAPGGGNHWAFDCEAGRVLHQWQPIETLASVS